MPTYVAAQPGAMVRTPDGNVVFVGGGTPLADYGVSGAQLAEMLANGRAVDGAFPDIDPTPTPDTGDLLTSEVASATYATKLRRKDTASSLARTIPTAVLDGRVGDGADGDGIFGSNATITSDKSYRNLIVGAGVTVTVNRGVRINAQYAIITGTLRQEKVDGGNSTGTSQGTGPGAVGVAAGALVGIVQPGGQAGGLGTTGAGAAGGTSAAKTTEGGTAGAGGAGGASGATAAGAGGTAGARTLPMSRVRTLDLALASWLSTAGSTAVGGAAGGSGAGDGTNAGGGGGGGGTAGGFLFFVCGVLTGTGTITAPGGNGGNGGNAAGGNAAGGGGGGGGGGGLALVAALDSTAWTGTITAPGGTGGAAGASAGTGTAASAGSAGGVGVALLIPLTVPASAVADSRPLVVGGADGAAPLFATPTYLPAATGPFRFLGGPKETFTAGGTTYVRNPLQSGNNGWLGPRNGRAPFVVEWETDSPLFAFAIQPLNGRYRLKVDGQWVMDSTKATYVDGAVRWVQVSTNRSRKKRLYELHCDEAPFGGLAMGSATDTVHPPLVRKEPPTLWLGDSMTEGNMGNVAYSDNDRFEAFPWVASRILGWDNLIVDGEGGTGYINDGGLSDGRKPFPQRVTDDIATLTVKPERIVVTGGYNDGASAASAVTAAATDTYGRLAAACPGAPVWVVFLPDRGAPVPADQTALSNAVKAAAIVAPNVVAFIDGITGDWTPGPLATTTPLDPAAPFLTGSGTTAAPAGNGNSDYYRSQDGVHPSLAGHGNHGSRIAALIGETLAA